MAEPFVGGFLPPPSPNPSIGRGPPPPLPPKDASYMRTDGRLPSTASWQEVSRTESTLSGTANSTYSMFANMSAVERSKHLRVARMSPYLQFMAGPLLRYDTVDEFGVWRGAAMIVSEYPILNLALRHVRLLSRARACIAADAGSVYEPLPVLTYNWDPNFTPNGKLKRHVSSRTHGRSFDLAPHPSDPLSTVAPASPTNSDGEQNGNGFHANLEQRRVEGKELYVYYGNGG